jgi:hypothetical protein
MMTTTLIAQAAATPAKTSTVNPMMILSLALILGAITLAIVAMVNANTPLSGDDHH